MSGVIESPGTKSGDSQSTTEQAKEKVQETTQQVQEKAGELGSQASSRLRSEIDTRTTTAGTQLQTTASAMRKTGQSLRQDGNQTEAKLIDGVADRAERLGGYMTNVNADRLLRDVEDFGRRQPWLLAVGGAAVGFFASRFMKASSDKRYGGHESQRRSLPAGSSESDALNVNDLDAPSSRQSSAKTGQKAAAGSPAKPRKQSGGSSGDQQ